MTLTGLSGKTVAVLGFGLEGQATCKYLQKHKIKCVLFDNKPLELFPAEIQAQIKAAKVPFIFGPDSFKELAGCEVAFRTPGLPLSHPDVQAAQSKGLIITSQTKFFFENCPGQIIGVTGTKGKGTTATLIYKMLLAEESAGITNVFLTGNIGETQGFEILDNLTPASKIVFELSSFQLEDLRLSPHVAVVLMLTSEHLDYHETTENYRKAKEAITKYQTKNDIAVINADFKASKQIGELSGGTKLYFSLKSKVQVGVFVDQGALKFTNSEGESTVIKLSEVKLLGKHNQENICAATAAAFACGSSLSSVTKVLREFSGLPHRLELAGQVEGVTFYDDSYSTIPETAIAAINSFTQPLILILGGSEKHSDYSKLGSAVADAKNVKEIILVGVMAGKIKQAIDLTHKFKGKLSDGGKTMQEIVMKAKALAKAGDIVLLSPAAASFDMFENYKDRGNQFKAEVKKLASI